MPAGRDAHGARQQGVANRAASLETLRHALRYLTMPSTAIRLISYDEASQRLSVTFVTGRRYLYERVPQYIYDAFVRAPSHGTFFNAEIRGFYEYREITRHDPLRKRSA